MKLRHVLLEVHGDEVEEGPALVRKEDLAALTDNVGYQFAEMPAVAKRLVAANP